MSKWPGVFKACCDVCGFWFHSDELRKRWDNLMVCNEDWELRHPSTYVRTVTEHITPPWVNPDPGDNFILYCNLYNRQGIAGVSVAGCAIAGNTVGFVVQNAVGGGGSINPGVYYLTDDLGNNYVDDFGNKLIL